MITEHKRRGDRIMDIKKLRESIEKTATVSFSKSGGPGGQNVNKVNTKVLISIDIETLEGLYSTEKERVKQKLHGKIREGSILAIFADEERSQYRNRETGTERLLKMIETAAQMEKKRVPTKPGRAAKIARLEKKKRHSTNKATRTKQITDE
jgi:ribosome-associated protein